MPATIEKVSIIISKGSLDGVYPGLIMANGARAEGIEANLFFTFFGLDAIRKARHEHIKIATVGNPGLHLSTAPSSRTPLRPSTNPSARCRH
jgi:peroxiredoxin family protein